MFDAKASAYEALLRQLRMVMLTVQRTHPMLGPLPPPPDPPSDEEWEDMYVRVSIYGSEELLEAFRAFHDRVREFHAHAYTYDALTAQHAPLGDSGISMHDARVQAGDALGVVEQRMRDDLAGL